MNVVSKIMAFLMLILSIVYCGTSVVLFTHRVDWRSKYEKVSADYKKESTDLKSKVAQLKDKIVSTNDALEAVKTSLENMTNDFKEKRDELSEANNRVTKLEAIVSSKDLKIDAKDRELSEKDQMVMDLRAKTDELKEITDTAKAERLEATTKRAEAEESLQVLKTELEKAEIKLADVTKQLEINKGIIAQLRENGIPVEEIAISGGPATPIRAQVLAVRADANLVMLSVGSQNEVKQGYRFTVYRDSEYLGKVEVEKIFPDMCSARILNDYTEKQIKEGDNASTRVY